MPISCPYYWPSLSGLALCKTAGGPTGLSSPDSTWGFPYNTCSRNPHKDSSCLMKCQALSLLEFLKKCTWKPKLNSNTNILLMVTHSCLGQFLFELLQCTLLRFVFEDQLKVTTGPECGYTHNYKCPFAVQAALASGFLLNTIQGAGYYL